MMFFNGKQEKEGGEASSSMDRTEASRALEGLSRYGRDELNLAEFPISLLTDRPSKEQAGQGSLVYEDTVFDKKLGQNIPRKVRVEASVTYGLPRPFDMDVLLCLIYLTKKSNDFKSRTVPYSRGELVRLLGITDGGDNYARVDESLNRWFTTNLFFEGAWWDAELGEWTSLDGIHILEKVSVIDAKKLRDRRAKGQIELPLSSFTWSEDIFKSFASTFMRKIDLEIYLDLKRPISKRMFRYLGKHFYRTNVLRLDLEDFAFNHVGISRYYAKGNKSIDYGKCKGVLNPGLEELERIGFLKATPRENRYFKHSTGRWEIILERGEVSPPQAEPKPIEPPSDLVQQLIERNITPKEARRLVNQCPADKIRLHIEHFDHLVAIKSPKVSTNPAGFLADSIRSDYTPEKNFKSKEDRAREAAAKEVAAQKTREDRRRKEEAEARTRQERDLITAYWNGLNKDQQAAHLDAAIAQATAQELDLIQPGPMKRFGMNLLRDSYTRKLLQAEGKLIPAEG